MANDTELFLSGGERGCTRGVCKFECFHIGGVLMWGEFQVGIFQAGYVQMGVASSVVFSNNGVPQSRLLESLRIRHMSGD